MTFKLEYGAIAWNPHTKNSIDTLEKIQRRVSVQRALHTFKADLAGGHYKGEDPHLMVLCTHTRNSDPNKYIQMQACVKQKHILSTLEL